MKCAAAVFVKTPGASPLKTRLAQSIGEEAATRFHVLASRALQATLSEASLLTAGELQPYWAVAESGSMKNRLWGVFPTIHQGEGELGARLNKVHAELQQKRGQVLLLGADSPQLTPGTLTQALEKLADPAVSFVVGPAEDGGFYLLASKQPIPAEVWAGITYSDPSTLQTLEKKLAPLGRIEKLAVHSDVDRAEDLPKLARALEAIPGESRSHEQDDLLQWLSRQTER